MKLYLGVLSCNKEGDKGVAGTLWVSKTCGLVGLGCRAWDGCGIGSCEMYRCGCDLASKRVVLGSGIVSCVNRYGMRYVAMQLRLALAEKFPDASDDEILKVVGNLIYYRYMNPAIVAPDAFDIVSLSADKGLNPDQVRRRQTVLCVVTVFRASMSLLMHYYIYALRVGKLVCCCTIWLSRKWSLVHV
jgi:hypothetical protein